MKNALFLFALQQTKLYSIQTGVKESWTIQTSMKIFIISTKIHSTLTLLRNIRQLLTLIYEKTTFEVDRVYSVLPLRRFGHQLHQLELHIVALRTAHRQVEAVLPRQLPVGDCTLLVGDDELASLIVVRRHRDVQRRLLRIWTRG